MEKYGKKIEKIGESSYRISWLDVEKMQTVVSQDLRLEGEEEQVKIALNANLNSLRERNESFFEVEAEVGGEDVGTV